MMKKPSRPVVRIVEWPVILRTELRTGSGVKTLSERQSTETRHIRFYPDGRCELLPRIYTCRALSGERVRIPSRNCARGVFVRTEMAYRAIEQNLMKGGRS